MENTHSIHSKSALRLSNQESKRFTRDCIKTALLQLLKDYTFEDITITSIINRAGVSRAGFYRNYTSKEDILEELAQITYEEIVSIVTDEKIKTDKRQWCLNFFTAVKNNADTYQTLIHANVPHQYLFRVGTLIESTLVFETAKERYHSIAITNALKEIAIDWFQHGMQESPEEMAELFVELFHF